jgi:histidine triad (HIT) family protein
VSLSAPLLLPFDFPSAAINDCAFCRSASTTDRRTIAVNPDAEAFLTIQPIVPGHTLIVPRRCVGSFDKLRPQEITSIFCLYERVKVALRAAFGAEGFNYAWNEGEVAGQTVPHFHLHVVPRKENDAGVYGYDPRRFFYRPGPRKNSTIREIEDLAEVVRGHLAGKARVGSGT